jgi:hypothetical protein
MLRIPDPNFSIPDPGSRVKKSRIRIRNKEFNYILPTKVLQSSQKYDTRFSSQIPDPDCFSNSGSRIRIRNTATEYDFVLCSDWLTVAGPTILWVPEIESSR